MIFLAMKPADYAEIKKVKRFTKIMSQAVVQHGIARTCHMTDQQRYRTLMQFFADYYREQKGCLDIFTEV